MGSGIAKELNDFSIRREPRESGILSEAANYLGDQISAFVKTFCKTNAKTIESEFVILDPEANGGLYASTTHTVQQHKLFKEFETAIDSILQAYLDGNAISKETFLQECQDSLNDKYCVFLDEDQNKWFVETLMAHASFKDFFQLMRRRHAHVQIIEKLEKKSVQLFLKPAATTSEAFAWAPSKGAPLTGEHDLHADIARVKAPEIDMDMTLLAEASVALKGRIDKFISSFFRQHSCAIQKEFVGVDNAEYTLGQYALFQEYHDTIDRILEDYLSDKGTTKEIFLGQCKASLQDQFCALFDEDVNKWFVELLIGHTQFKNFFHLMLHKQTQLLLEQSTVTDSAQRKEEQRLYGDF